MLHQNLKVSLFVDAVFGDHLREKKQIITWATTKVRLPLIFSHLQTRHRRSRTLKENIKRVIYTLNSTCILHFSPRDPHHRLVAFPPQWHVLLVVVQGYAVQVALLQMILLLPPLLQSP